MQESPSSQAAVTSACVHPVSGRHPSTVQASPSSQSAAEVSLPEQTPPAQMSPVVQELPSLQTAVLFV